MVVFENDSFSQQERKQLVDSVRESPFDWIFQKYPDGSFHGYAEYVAKFQEDNSESPAIFQALITPNQDLSIFLSKIKEGRLSLEKIEFCKFCNKTHVRSFNHHSYCVLAKEKEHAGARQ